MFAFACWWLMHIFLKQRLCNIMKFVKNLARFWLFPGLTQSATQTVTIFLNLRNFYILKRIIEEWWTDPGSVLLPDKTETLVELPNWHAFGCHFQEQVGWGTRLKDISNENDHIMELLQKDLPYNFAIISPVAEVYGGVHEDLQPDLHDAAHMPLVRMPSGHWWRFCWRSWQKWHKTWWF